MVLGYSRALAALFTLDQTLESFLRGHVEAFDALGGVARTLVYDCVPRHTIDLVCPFVICGPAPGWRRISWADLERATT